MVTRHLTRCFLAGIVALLPVGGTVLTIVWLEATISGSWLAEQPFYFPGLGLLLVVSAVYLVGLCVTTFVGRWLWRATDGLLASLPAVGPLFQTLKQLLGYGAGEDAMFREVVMVPCLDNGGEQIGLLTERIDGDRCVVFLPGAPNPTAGRLVVLPESQVQPTDTLVADALKALVSVGNAPMPRVLGKG